MQRDRTVRKGQEAVIEPKQSCDTLGLALSDDRGGRNRWRIQRDEQREHLAAESLVEREVAADCYDLVVGMGRHDEHTLLLNCTELDRHTVRDAVNTAEETCRRPLKYAVKKWWSPHWKFLPITCTHGAAVRPASSSLDQADPVYCTMIPAEVRSNLAYFMSHLNFTPTKHT